MFGLWDDLDLRLLSIDWAQYCPDGWDLAYVGFCCSLALPPALPFGSADLPHLNTPMLDPTQTRRRKTLLAFPQIRGRIRSTHVTRKATGPQ